MMNPYSNKGGIRRSGEFFGRRRELSELYGLIASGSAVSLVGERRVGKSSLLNAVALGFARERLSWELPGNICVALLDCQFHEDSSEAEFVDSLVKRIVQASRSLAAFSAEVPLAENVSSINNPGRNVLIRLAETLRDSSPPSRLVILLDEVDVVFHNPKISAELFSFFRAWIQQYEISMVIASREGSIDPLVKSDVAGSPFWNIFKSFYLGPFSDTEARELITTPAEQEGHPFSPLQIEEILNLGGYHPYFLQLACYHMFRWNSTNPENPHDFSDVEAEFRREAIPHFAYLWGRLSERERLTVQHNGAQMNPELIRKGVLIPIDSKKSSYRFFSKEFADFISTARPKVTEVEVESGFKQLTNKLFGSR
jgi:hypothetical protein